MNYSKILTALALPYLGGVCACYLFGYWGSFDVNVLEFITLWDLAKLAIYPISLGIVLLVVGQIFAELTLSKLLPPGGARYRKALSKAVAEGVDPANFVFEDPGVPEWPKLAALHLLVVALVLVWGSEPAKWNLMASLLTVWGVWCTHLKIVEEFIAEPRLRLIICCIAIGMPSYAFSYGKQDAYCISNQMSGFAVDVVRSKLDLTFDVDHPVNYLGLLDGTYIFRESLTGQIVFVPKSDAQVLVLTKVKK